MTILKNIKDMILEQIQDKANRSELPTRVSDLYNDLNLVTEEDLSLKVDREDDKGLSTNDFTDDLFFKLKNFFYETELNSIETLLTALNNNEEYNNIYTDEKIDDYLSDPTLENINSLFESPEKIIKDYYSYIVFDEYPVKFAIMTIEVEEDSFKSYLYLDNSYDSFVFDLTKADIDPSIMPDLSNYIQKSNTSGLIKNDGTIDTKQYLDTNQQNHSNKNVVVNLNGEIDFEDKPVNPNYGYIDDNFNLNLLYLEITNLNYLIAFDGTYSFVASIKDEFGNSLEGIYVDFFSQVEGEEEDLIETVITDSNGIASTEDISISNSVQIIARVSDTIEKRITIGD